MATRKIVKAKQQYRAKLLSEDDKTLPCIFCNRKVDDEPIYGKIYAIGDIQCHYFCALLSCCLIQKGKDCEGLFGFLYRDILAEVERCKKHKCSYCGQFGANLGCTVSQCRKQFHLPCGREKNAVSMFYGNYKSYCQQHAPKQQISEHIMIKARQRMPKRSKNNARNENSQEANKNNNEGVQEISKQDDTVDVESVCVICYERVDTYPTINTFWPPCCGKDAWFHRCCLQRMALSAGMHYLKCPLCNDKEKFYEAVLEQGYYIPDRDASWELEQNAFQEIYSRVLICSVDCKCPNGREYDADSGPWDIILCGLCGSICAHLYCYTNDETLYTMQAKQEATFVCETCKQVAGEQLEVLLDSVNKLIQQEQAKSSDRNSDCRRIMPSRMSLRRTKQGAAPQPSTSRISLPPPIIETKSQELTPPTNTTISRQELNLPTPKRRSLLNSIPINIENNLLSPLKLLEQGLIEKMGSMNVRDDIVLNSNFVISVMRQKFAKPKPLSEKRRIIDDILEGLLKNQLKESPKNKNPVREWSSPQKRTEQCTDIQTTPEKPSSELNKTPIKSDKKPTEPIEIKQEIPDINIKEEIPNIPNQILINLLNEIDNRKHSPIETLFHKANKFINNNSTIEHDIKLVKTEIIDSESENVADKEIDKNDGNKNIEDLTTDENVEINGKCALKFSSVDKEKLWNRNYNLDLETFKNSYLNEVATCNFGHKHTTTNKVESQLMTAIDFAKKASIDKRKEQPKKDLKRKPQNEAKTKNNKRKRPNTKANKKKNAKSRKRVSESSDDFILPKNKERKKKNKTARLSIKDKNLKLKIKWKEQELKLKISNKSNKKDHKMTQYVLSYGENTRQVITKPVNETPRKRKNVKTNKSSDNLKQTSIQNFFSIKS